MQSRTPVFISPEKALERLIRLCNASERCTWELKEKMHKWGLNSTESAKIIRQLTDARLVDDRRFANLFAEDKLKFSGWGRKKIAYALSLKHIPSEIIREALGNLDDKVYRSKAAEIICAKARILPDAFSFEGRTKLYRFALSRGFESDLVSDIIRRDFRDPVTK